MVDYNIAVTSPPIGGRAVANLATFDSGALSDVTSVTADWRDQAGVLVETLTRTSSDASGTDIYGNASTITDPSGTGTYQATLVIDATHYAPTQAGFRWSLTVTVVKGGSSDVQVFYFSIVPSTLTISLDPLAVSTSVMRQLGLMETIQSVKENTGSIISLGGITYAISEAYKNGVAMVAGTDYSWSMYRSNVQVTPAPAINDHYTFVVQRRSSDFISDVVTRFTEEVRSELQPFFNTTSLMTSPTVVELVKQMCIGQLRMDSDKGTAGRGETRSSTFRTGEAMLKAAHDKLMHIQQGRANIYDSAGVRVPRVVGSLAGHYEHADGDFVNRLGIQDRLQRHTGLFITLYPDPIMDLRRETILAA